MLTALTTHPCALIFTNRHPASNWTPWSLDASTWDSRVRWESASGTLRAGAGLSRSRCSRVAAWFRSTFTNPTSRLSQSNQSRLHLTLSAPVRPVNRRRRLQLSRRASATASSDSEQIRRRTKTFVLRLKNSIAQSIARQPWAMLPSKQPTVMLKSILPRFRPARSA